MAYAELTRPRVLRSLVHNARKSSVLLLTRTEQLLFILTLCLSLFLRRLIVLVTGILELVVATSTRKTTKCPRISTAESNLVVQLQLDRYSWLA
jgi:hypothetical protein